MESLMPETIGDPFWCKLVSVRSFGACRPGVSAAVRCTWSTTPKTTVSDRGLVPQNTPVPVTSSDGAYGN